MCEEVKNLKDAHDKKEIVDIIEAVAELRRQKNFPTKDGMIQALSNAQDKAKEEIQKAEHEDGDVIFRFWFDFPEQDLYRKLSQYERALCEKAEKKIGKAVFEKLVKERT